MANPATGIARLRAALAATEAGATAAEAELPQARAVVPTSEALIRHLRLEIARLRREQHGQSSKRRARLIGQLELQLEDLEAAATEDGSAAGKAADATTTVQSFERRRPSCQPFREHLPRKRVVVEAPTACACCGSARLVKMGEDGTEMPKVAPLEGDPDRAGEVHLP